MLESRLGTPERLALAKKFLYQPKRLRRVTTKTPRRLHIGCGHVYVEGFCNVDVDPTTKADIVDDVLVLRKFPDDFAELLYASHVLEHLPHAEVPKVLRRWHSVLRPGGELRVSVPDMDRITDIYRRNLEHFHKPGHAPWVGLIYGGQSDPYDFHKTGFNFTWMRHLLTDAGFEEIEEYPHEPHFLAVHDSSLSNEPFGEFISLNVRARKAVRRTI